jgi:2-haloacid dehalogenase
MKKHVNFWKITEDSLNFAMENHNINPKFKNQLLDLYKKLNAYPELRDCLIKLKNKNIKTCILSNGTPDLLHELVTNSNTKDLFDDLISIEKVGVYKPDPKVYALVTDQYNCKPNEVCFMSSNTWDVVGGGVFGYQSVWVDRFNKVFDQLDFMPKFKIKNLSELDKII